MIRNHTIWHDVNNLPIDCHEGMILRHGERFYWYGRRYAGNFEAIYGPKFVHLRLGIACYSSTDLEHWTPHGEVLSYPTDGWMTTGSWHRPRLLFNEKTKKFVLWIFCLGNDGNWWARDIVSTSDSPTGPFTILHEAVHNISRYSGDHALIDVDGKGYFAKGDWERNNSIIALSDDFTTTLGDPVIAMKADKEKQLAYEGVCLTKLGRTYLAAGSRVVGIGPSETNYSVAAAPLGPWRERGQMSENRTWGSQISSFLYLKESNRLMALCDQWLTGPDGGKIAAELSCQLWLPVDWDATTQTAKMRYEKAWDEWK